jgi:broad specificity phosphatase PhoE
MGWDAVFLARHGETLWNKQRRRQGQLDSALTAGGLEQAEHHAMRLLPHAIDAIFASPLGRAVATAQVIGERLRLTVEVVEELAEVDHGRLAGLTREEIDARYADEWARRSLDKYAWRFPGGESYADADTRAGRALARLATYAAHRPLIVSHEMIGKMLQRHLLGLSVDEALACMHPNDVIYKIDPVRGLRHEID